jgi:hypothetical protein
MTTTVESPYGDFDDKLNGTVDEAASEGVVFVKDNFGKAMIVTGAFVLWRIGKRVIRSIA